MKHIILKIKGMSCSACSSGLEKYLNKQEGIVKATVNLVMATATITYNETLKQNDIETFIKEAGFESLGVDCPLEEEKKESIFPFFIYGFLAIFLMYISMSPMLNFPFFNIHHKPILYSICLFFLTLPFLVFGLDIIKKGVKNLIHKMPNMDTLVSLGITSSFLYSLFGVIMILLGEKSYMHRLYFESVVFVIYFIKLGRFIDHKVTAKTKDAIQKLVTITPTVAKKKTKNGYEEVTIDEVKKGDILICLKGDKVAVDGEIIKGKSHFDESFLTGESMPYEKKEKDFVLAGAVNYDGYIEYKALKIGKDSMISEIVHLVTEVASTKAPISILADKISGYFVPAVMIFSLLTFIFSLFLGISFEESLTRFVTVLVVACPCALGLATPLATIVSEGVCAKKGIFIKKSETLEMANYIDTIVFDKTGTLTNGILSVFKIYCYEKKEKDLLFILGSMESKSTHPISKGILKYIERKKIKISNLFEVTDLSGLGIKGIYKGNTYYAGNAKLVKKIKVSNPYIKEEERLAKNGNSVIYVIENGKIIGLIGIKDTVREGVKDCLLKLKKKNIDVIMLTGDHKQTALKIGKEIGIKNIIADVMPKEKVEVIQTLKEKGRKVMMVGDGINDAPSLALADIGVSFKSGTDIAADSSDVILMNDQIHNIYDFLFIGKKTLWNIKQNLFWAFLYNLCMIPIAAGLFTSFGLSINPMIACLSMILSSFTVLLNAIRLKSIKI